MQLFSPTRITDYGKGLRDSIDSNQTRVLIGTTATDKEFRLQCDMINVTLITDRACLVAPSGRVAVQLLRQLLRG